MSSERLRVRRDVGSTRSSTRIEGKQVPSATSTVQRSTRYSSPHQDSNLIQNGRIATPSSPEREGRKAELHKRAKDTVSRIHKLQEEHEAGKGKRDRNNIIPKNSHSSLSSLNLRRRQSMPEYDPENPFDDRKEIKDDRATKQYTSQRHPQIASVSPKVVEITSKNAQEGRSSRIGKELTRFDPNRSSSSARQNVTKHKHVGPPSPSKSASKIATQIPSQGRERLRRRQTTTEGENMSEKVGRIEPCIELALQQEKVGLSHTQLKEQNSQGLKEVGQQKSPERSTNRKARRKTESYIAPTFERTNGSPSALSEETVQALASLERTLERLKSLSPENRRMEDSVITRKDVIPDLQTRNSASKSRPSRALSPSKEMREVNRNRRSANSPEQENRISNLVDAALPPRPRTSFLARIDNVRSKLDGSPRDVKRSTEKKTKDEAQQTVDTDRLEVQTQTAPVVRRRSLYTYTPPMLIDKGQQCSSNSTDDIFKGDESTLNTSASSIKIGDESVDDLVKSHGTEEDGKLKQFLSGVKILVDVRDQDGDDAGAIWMEKLRAVGAKVYSKPPQIPRKSKTSAGKGDEKELNLAPGLDFIIYKHGKPATLHYYRAQIESGRQPIIVGVNWILHCLREGRKVEERDYLVEVAKHPVFTKRRTSMTPKRAPNVSSPTSLVDNIDLQQQILEQDQSFDQQDTSTTYQPVKLADLLAKKKLIQNAPVRPSPLASRCWNLEASTNSTMSTATTMTNYTLNMNNTANLTNQSNLSNFWT